jgi:hypothetical protein
MEPEVKLEDLTVAQIKAELDQRKIDYSEVKLKADLLNLLKENLNVNADAGVDVVLPDEKEEAESELDKVLEENKELILQNTALKGMLEKKMLMPNDAVAIFKEIYAAKHDTVKIERIFKKTGLLEVIRG